MEYGLQLYSIRDITKENLDGALDKVARLGYKTVEFAGFFDHSAAQITEMLQKHSLRLIGSHSSFKDLAENFEGTLAFHKELGNKYYIIPGHKLPNQTALDEFVALVNPISKKLEKEGISLCYHNHDKEFLPTEDGAQVYDQLLYRTNLLLEVDAYWAFVGMKDPVRLMDRVADRLRLMHIKDGFADGSGMLLGKGEAPVEEMWKWAKEHHIPMIVESETLTPDGITEAQICIDYLRFIEEKNK